MSRTSPLVCISLVALLGCTAEGKFEAKGAFDLNAGASGEAEAEGRIETGEDETAIKVVRDTESGEAVLDYEGEILFAYDKADIRTDDAATRKALEEMSGFLQRNTEVNIRIEGHTDSRGSQRYNKDLSDRRAAALRQWLVDAGIDGDRLTSVGMGEDAPKVAEPPECLNQEPEDTTPCEGPWQQNRRALFKVTSGAETIAEPTQVAEATPEPVTPPPGKDDVECPWLFGFHANLLGPNSLFGLEGATQPGICWLELSLGFGYRHRFRDFEAGPIAGTNARARVNVVPVTFRGRFWFMDTHSLIADAGVGLMRYRIKGRVGDFPFRYERTGTTFTGFLGIGYGYRPGPVPGFRFGALVGAYFQATPLDDSDVTAPNTPLPTALALRDDLDDDTSGLKKPKPYGELSFGWLW